MDKMNFDKKIGDLCKANVLDDLLCKAVQEGNFKTACRLINQGADIEITENSRKEPVVKEDEEFANGYRITIPNYTANPKCYDSLPLCLAIEANDYKMAEMLISAGCDIKKAQKSFVYAAKEGYVHMVELLIRNRIDVTYNNYQALRYAISSNQTEIVEMIVKESYEITPEHYKALEYAAVNGAESLLELLIVKHADVNGFTTKPIRLATKCGQTEIVNILLRAGAKVTEEDVKVAEECKYEEIAKLIRMYLKNN